MNRQNIEFNSSQDKLKAEAPVHKIKKIVEVGVISLRSGVGIYASEAPRFVCFVRHLKHFYGCLREGDNILIMMYDQSGPLKK